MANRSISPRQFLNTLRTYRLGWLVPFYCRIDSYYTENNLAVLSVFTWRFGRQAWETWRLEEGMVAESVNMQAPPARLYHRLKLSGNLVHRHCLNGN